MATFEQVAKVLGVLSLMTAKIELSEERIQAYHRILADIPHDILELAAMQVAVNNTFFPAVADIRKAACDLIAQAEGVPTAWEAWKEVVKSFSTHGFYRGAPEWSHPLVGQAVDAIGGYAALCHSENSIADRARFVQCYDSLLTRDKEQRQMLPEVREKIEELAAGMRIHYLPKGE